MAETIPKQLDPSWRGHILATLRLGVPVIGSQLAFIGLGVTDTIMLGWLGAEPLAASVLATQLWFLLFVGGAGLAHAVAPIVANALGAEDHRSVRRSVRMAIWGALIYSAFAIWPLWFSEPLLRLIGQDPELTLMAQDYLRIALWSMPLALVHNTIRSYLTALEHAGILFWATIVGLLVNGLINYAFIFGNWGAPALGIRGAAIATVTTNGLMLALMVVYAASRADLKQYQVFNRFWIPDWPALGECFRLGWPISLNILAEVSLFTTASFMMGWLGVITLAAHGIALQVASVVFMIPLGLSFVATVRVGRAVGRMDPLGLHRASVTVFWMAIGIAVFTAVVLVVLPEPLIWLFLDADNPDAAEIAKIAVPLLAVAAIFQLVDNAQAVAGGMLRGLKDTRVPMYLAVVSYSVFGVGTAYGLGFVAGWGGVGIWAGLAIGLAIASVLLLSRYAILIRTAI